MFWLNTTGKNLTFVILILISCSLAMSKSNPALFKESLVSLASDSGLDPLVPYYTNFIADEATLSTTGHSNYLLILFSHAGITYVV